jgi:hypothetical protein
MIASQTAVMARRNLLHVLSDPQQMIGMSVQPLMFLLLFVYVFGGPSPVPPATTWSSCSPAWWSRGLRSAPRRQRSD